MLFGVFLDDVFRSLTFYNTTLLIFQLSLCWLESVIHLVCFFVVEFRHKAFGFCTLFTN